MALILCSGCGKASITVDRKCQFCGKALRFSIWTRKLRRNEAYGFLLLLTGTLLLTTFKPLGILTLLSGLALLSLTLLKPRVPPVKPNLKSSIEQPEIFEI